MARSAKEVNISSTLLKGSDVDYDICCQQCNRANINAEAFGFCQDCDENLCKSCYDQHSRAKPSQNHTLKNQTKTIQSKNSSTAHHNNSSIPCRLHKQEILKFYCNDHKEVLCSVCVTLSHQRTRCKLDYIPEISTQFLDSNEYKTMLVNLKTVTEKYQNKTKKFREEIIKSNRSLTKILKDIKTFRDEVNKKINELETQAKTQANKIKTENDNRLIKTEKVCKEVTDELKTSIDTVKQLNSSKDADSLFIKLKSAQQLILDGETKLSQLMASEDIKEYEFKPNKTLNTSIANEKTLGAVSPKETNLAKPTNTLPPPPKQSSDMEKILIKTETNQKQCYILNMALLTQYKLILVDSNNSSIKLIDLNSNSVTCELPQEKVPESITSVTGSKAAVTFPTNGTVQFIHRTLDRLNLVNKLDVGETCCGISCANEKLAVTFRFPPKLQVIDMNGGIISTVKDGPDGKDIFKRPTYITSSNHNIFVSDEVTKEVIKLNWQGEMTGKYASNSVPKGVTLKGSRDILLCLPYKKTIEQLAEDLKTTRTLLKVERPCAITWCGIKGKVYISCHNYNEEDNYIKVYKI